MKHSLLFPLIILSLTLTSCTWGPKKPAENLISGENPVIISDDKIVDTEKSEATEVKPDTTTKNTPKTTTPVTKPSEDATKKNPEVSTEDLTKEPDDYVDDITKGL